MPGALPGSFVSSHTLMIRVTTDTADAFVDSRQVWRPDSIIRI
jgi:hypothetical protein